MLQIKTFEFNSFQENTYVLYNANNSCIIIDPGCYFENECDELIEFISSNNLTPKLLLNTHCHLDHVFGNRLVAERYKLCLHINERELAVLRYAPRSGLIYNLPFENYDGKFIFLDDGDKIKLGDDELVVLETPGHSVGSLSFYCANQNFVISGDTLFLNGIGRTDLPGAMHTQLLKSIRKKLLKLPEDTIVYSGHGMPTSIGYEKINNPFLQLES
ncbi:MAG: MBL fold metallo-hydrolase [Ferruginibacter sp.]|nr:MBL fold metallo-hydrolase [Ferruginibacter sp.]